LVRYEAWKRIVELSGPHGLREIKGFHDEALKGKWKGFRSSRLGDPWRVIYKFRSSRCEVYVVEVQAGMTQSNLCALETGARNIGRDRALALAKALKVHPAVILFPDFDIGDVA
jgi:mRNA-degrading endonuclease RelE of RelBE toxin-antitoxin system